MGVNSISDRIRRYAANYKLSPLAQDNLKRLIADPHADNIRIALIELLDGGLMESLRIFHQYKHENKAERIQALGTLVQAVSCQRRIRNSRIEGIFRKMRKVGKGANSRALKTDFILQIDRASIPQAETQLYDLDDGYYVGESEVHNSGSLDEAVRQFVEERLPIYIKVAKRLKLFRTYERNVKGIVLTVGGALAKGYPERFRQTFIDIETDNEELNAAGLKLYLYLVPETIYDEGPKTTLDDDDKEFVKNIISMLAPLNNIVPQRVHDCRTVIERAVLSVGVDAVRKELEQKAKGIITASVEELEVYSEAILALDGIIAAKEKKDILIINADCVDQAAIEHAFFPGKKLHRVKDHRVKSYTLQLQPHAYGAFEIFYEPSSNTIYLTPPLDKILEASALGIPVTKEYFAFNLNLKSDNILAYHYDGRSVALDVFLPRKLVELTKNVDVPTVKGLLREVVAFRRLVIEHPESDYYHADGLHSNMLMHMLSYNMLSMHRHPHFTKLMGFYGRTLDYYVVDANFRLKHLIEIGNHNVLECAHKFSMGYKMLTADPYAQEVGDMNLKPADELILSVGFSYDRSKNERDPSGRARPNAFKRKARSLANIFLQRLWHRRMFAIDGSEVLIPLPRQIVVRDEVEHWQTSFIVNEGARPTDRKLRSRKERAERPLPQGRIRTAGEVVAFEPFKDIPLLELFLKSERIIQQRLKPIRLSEVPDTDLYKYGYIRIDRTDGRYVIAPVKGLRQRYLPSNWIMDLPFSLRPVPKALGFDWMFTTTMIEGNKTRAIELAISQSA